MNSLISELVGVVSSFAAAAAPFGRSIRGLSFFGLFSYCCAPSYSR